MTTTRTDIHRPVALVTEDYDYFGSYDCGTADERPDFAAQRLLRKLHPNMQGSGVYDCNEKCDHCGARIRYGALLIHKPSNTYIHVGETCLDNRFELATADFQALRKAAALNRERRALKDRIAEFCDCNPVAVWVTYQNNLYVSGGEEVEDAEGTYTRDTLAEYLKAGKLFSILADLSSTLHRYGNLSPKQLELVEKLITQLTERYERQVR